MKQSRTIVVKGTLTQEQVSAIDSLIGTIGSNRQDAVGKILVFWLLEKNLIKKQKK